MREGQRSATKLCNLLHNQVVFSSGLSIWLSLLLLCFDPCSTMGVTIAIQSALQQLLDLRCHNLSSFEHPPLKLRKWLPSWSGRQQLSNTRAKISTQFCGRDSASLVQNVCVAFSLSTTCRSLAVDETSWLRGIDANQGRSSFGRAKGSTLRTCPIPVSVLIPAQREVPKASIIIRF